MYELVEMAGVGISGGGDGVCTNCWRWQIYRISACGRCDVHILRLMSTGNSDVLVLAPT